MEKQLGTNVSIDDMPPIVHRPYAFLLDGTDIEPVVERTGYGRIRLVHLGERTRMTIDFRLNRTTWDWHKSSLFVDGKKVPNAANWDMYVAIFKDPDNGRKNFVPEGARKAVLPKVQPVEDEQHLPKYVADELKSLRSASLKDTTSVTALVNSKKNEYVLTVLDGTNDSKFLFTFGIGPDGKWTITDVMLVNSTGYDITAHLTHGEVEEFLHDLLGSIGRKTQVTTVPYGHVHRAAVSSSVEVRKSTVFRI